MPRRKSLERKPKNKAILLPSPSTMLNCACSDSYLGAFPLGAYINLIGDSHAGKTILALSILAEAYHSSKFKDYDLIYDDSEHSNMFNMDRMFGNGFGEAIKAPFYSEDGTPYHSEMIEDFHINIMDAIKRGKPFIYVLDSLDALDSEQDEKKAEEMMEARRKGTKTTGTYGMAKPKKSSQLLRQICGRVEKTDSILIIISQTRDNISPMARKKKTKSGGTSWKFFMIHEIWLNEAGKIKHPTEKKMVIGAHVKAKVEKNKVTGKIREVGFDVYYDYGVDDINSCIKFLIERNVWKKKGAYVTVPEYDFHGYQKDLVKHIEDNNLERKMRRLVGKTWTELEDKIKLNRKPKYS